MFRLAAFQPGKRRKVWLLLSMSVLIVMLLSAAVPAPAQDIILGSDENTPAATQGDYPTDEQMASLRQPEIISQVRRGDKTTVTIDIPAASDTFTSSGMPNNNWANDPNMRVGFNTLNGLGATRSFLFFNLNSIPANATIQSANLRLWVNSFSPNGDGAMGIQARFLNSAWDPNTLTWANYNPAWGATIGVGNVPAAIGWVQGNATDPVREWYTGARQNFGVMLQGDETPQQRERVFTTINANNQQFPRLVVTYDVSNDTTPPVATVNALPQFSPGSFLVTWQGTDNQSGIAWYDVQYRINGGGWIDWRARVTITQDTFNLATNGQLVEFRARARDNAGNEQAWSTNPQAATTVDTQAPTATVTVLPQFSQPNFTVSWSGSDNLSGIRNYDVQFSVNGGPWTNWQEGVTTTSATFPSTDGSQIGFRARATDNVGNVSAYPGVAQAATTVDGLPPNATVQALPQFSPPNFTVSWAGTDNLSGIKNYDVQFSLNGGPWTDWKLGVPAGSAAFPSTAGSQIGFRARATDNAGNVQPYSAVAQASTTVSSMPPTAQIVPFSPVIVNSLNVPVAWTGTAGPGAPIATYDVQYRQNGGAWVLWQNSVAITSATFKAPGEGTFEFQVRARDSQGQVGPWSSNPGSTVFVDNKAPFITPKIFMPFVVNG